MFKGIIKAIINQPFKSFSFFFIALVLSLNLCTAYIIDKAADNTRKEVLGSVDALIALKSRACDQVMMDRSYAGSAAFANVEEMLDYTGDYYADLLKLIADGHFSYADINMVMSNSLPIAVFDDELGIFISNYDLTFAQNSLEMMQRYLQGQIDYHMGYNIISTQNADFSDLHYDWIKIKEGRTFSDEEIADGANVAVIAQGFNTEIVDGAIFNPEFGYYDGNGFVPLGVGDHVTISLYLPQNEGLALYKSYDLEIVGFTDGSKQYAAEIQNGIYNGVIIPEKLFLKMIQDLEELFADYGYEAFGIQKDEEYYSPLIGFFPSIIELDTLDELDMAVREIENINYEEGKDYAYETTADRYTVLAGDIDSLSWGFKMLFVFSAFASVVLLGLVIILEMNLRRNEIAIYMAMGESKLRIIIRMLGEYLLIIIAAFSISLILAHLIAAYISGQMIDTSSMLENNITSNLLSLFTSPISNASISDAYNISLGIGDIVNLAFIEISILFLAVSFSLIYIMRLKPREIMFE